MEVLLEFEAKPEEAAHRNLLYYVQGKFQFPAYACTDLFPSKVHFMVDL
jgi:hypothetical protein